MLAGGTAAAFSLAASRAMAQAERSQTGEEMARPDMAYEGSKARRKLSIVNLLELEPEARKILPDGGFQYISGGSGSNWTREENQRAFQDVAQLVRRDLAHARALDARLVEQQRARIAEVAAGNHDLRLRPALGGGRDDLADRWRPGECGKRGEDAGCEDGSAFHEWKKRGCLGSAG